MKEETTPNSLSVQNLYAWLNSDDENPIIIDVREKMELDIASLSFIDLNIPMSEVSIEFVTSKIKNYSTRDLVIICHRGIRSFNFGQWLLENQLAKNVWNLEEGIDGWSTYIDSSVPRY